MMWEILNTSVKLTFMFLTFTFHAFPTELDYTVGKDDLLSFTAATSDNEGRNNYKIFVRSKLSYIWINRISS